MADRKVASAKPKQNTKTLSKDKASPPEILRIKWDMDMVSHILQFLLDYKSQMEYRNSDFNADKSKQYEAVRASLAERYEDIEISFFGPKEMLPMGEEDNREDYLQRIEIQKKQIRKGYNRVMEKIKELRQGFSNAVTAGTRSGSGKMVMEFYDLMVQIWGGSPATEPLEFGIHSSQVENDVLDDADLGDSELLLNTSGELGEEQDDLDVVGNGPDISNCKRTSCQSQVPKFIDDKRKKMERQLSAAQRDKLLMKEGREEKEFRREMSKSFQESNSIFAESLKSMSASMVVLTSSMQRSVDMSTMAQRATFQQPHNSQPLAPNVLQHGNYIAYQDIQETRPYRQEENTSEDQTYYQL